MNDDLEVPSFYAVIPASVRYDKNLRANEKLLYGEITALTNKFGACWASNNYFAKLYNVTPQAISKWILNLKTHGYVDISYVYEDNSQKIKTRIIKLISTNDLDISTNDSEGYQQKIKDNNTSKSNINYKDIVDYLNLKAGTNYRCTTKTTQSLINARLNDGFTIDDFKKVIDNKCYDWLNDAKMKPYLRPQTLFGTKFESYLNQNTQNNFVFEEPVKKEFEVPYEVKYKKKQTRTGFDDILGG